MDDNEIQLCNIDPDDVDQAIRKIEQSFGIKFTQNDLDGISNLGELCDVVEKNIDLPDTGGCTSQQAFYKLREAVLNIKDFDKGLLTPSARLEDIFPAANRRQEIKNVERAAAFSLKILKPQPWVSNTLAGCFLVTVVVVFIAWKVALAVFACLIILSCLANHFGNLFKLSTLGEAAGFIARENYRMARRNPNSINKDEVSGKIKELFMAHLYLPERALTRDAGFN